MTTADTTERPIKEVQDIERKRFMLNNQRDHWLRSRGWEQTCQTPGSRWMWKHRYTPNHGDVPLTLLVDANTAECIQGEWDHEEDVKQNPKDYEDLE